MALDTLQDLYLHQLLDLRSAEKQILEALPKMIKAANDEGLRQALSDHLEQTETHLQRVEQILESIPGGKKPMKCKGMEGLLEEGAEVLKEKGAPEVLDAAIIAAAQRVEHYEMAGYGTVHALARTLGETAAAAVLKQTLDEEEAADKKLTEIALMTVNAEAAAV